jgi:hypothetical protein
MSNRDTENIVRVLVSDKEKESASPLKISGEGSKQVNPMYAGPGKEQPFGADTEHTTGTGRTTAHIALLGN